MNLRKTFFFSLAVSCGTVHACKRMTITVGVADCLDISVFSSARDNVVQSKQLKLAEFIRLLTGEPEYVHNVAGPEDKQAKEAGELFCAAKYAPGHTRGKAGVESVCALVLDLDGDQKTGLTPAQVDQVFAWLEHTDFLYVAYNSWSSGYFAPNEKLRLVLFFDQPIAPEQYASVWKAVTDTMPVRPDETCQQYWRVYFTPRIPSEHEDLYDSSTGGSKRIPTGKLVPGVSLNTVEFKKDWLKALRTCENKHITLVSAAFGLGASAALAGKTLEQTQTDVWEACRKALAENSFSAPVKDWSAAEKTCLQQVNKGFDKGLSEVSERTVEVPQGFTPTPKQTDRAEKTLKQQLEHVLQDFSRVQQAAYQLGRFVPHVLAEDRVRKELFKAATQLGDSTKPGMNGAQAELEITTGLERGKKQPHFIFTGWRSKLLIDKDAGVIIPCEENARLLLQHHPACKDLLRWNVRTGKASVMSSPPWTTTERTEFPHDLQDHDGLDIGLWLAEQFGRPLPGGYRQCVRVAIEVARKNEYDPFRDWLEAQQWDAVPRLDTWLTNACGVEPSEYHQLVGSKWLMSAVARTLTPGCDAQHVLLFTGPQGIGKSQALRALASAEYFCSDAGELGSEDMIFNLSKYVIVELAELAGFRKKEMDEIKRLISNTSEDLRRKYAAASEQVVRRAVFGGTTNEEQFLRDETGNRRFWSVACTKKINIKWLEDNRAQLWAEAHHRVRNGKTWWPDTEIEEQLCSAPQREHLEIDELDDMLEKLRSEFSMSDYVGCEPTSEQIDSTTGKLKWATMPQVYHVLGLKIQIRSDQLRVKRMLKIRNWQKITVKIDGKNLKTVQW